MGESLFAVSHNLSDALHHCVQSSRRSTIGSRKTSSVGNASNLDMEVDINGPAYQRGLNPLYLSYLSYIRSIYPRPRGHPFLSPWNRCHGQTKASPSHPFPPSRPVHMT
uniref:Uncharacterized protein n=1 Tax=Magallana gigas TaxID=29159 RepID=A0A8W8M718_MAGGI